MKHAERLVTLDSRLNDSNQLFLENQRHTAQPVKSESRAYYFYKLVLFSESQTQHNQQTLSLERMILIDQFF